jgi:hypothetical protein
MEQLRICRTCKQEKPLSEFNKDKRHSSGYATQCKECKRAYDKSRYEKVKNNSEFRAKKLEHGQKYRETHKEQIKKYSTEYNMRPEVVTRKATWYQEKMSKMSIKERLELMVKRASHRAKLKEVDFNITWEDVEYVEICPILEIPLNWGETSNEGGRNVDTPSLDRINPELGYVKGNVKIISTLANMMKSSASKEQIRLFCKNIDKYLENEEIVRPADKKESAEQEDKEPLG